MLNIKIRSDKEFLMVRISICNQFFRIFIFNIIKLINFYYILQIFTFGYFGVHLISIIELPKKIFGFFSILLNGNINFNMRRKAQKTRSLLSRSISENELRSSEWWRAKRGASVCVVEFITKRRVVVNPQYTILLFSSSTPQKNGCLGNRIYFQLAVVLYCGSQDIRNIRKLTPNLNILHTLRRWQEKIQDKITQDKIPAWQSTGKTNHQGDKVPLFQIIYQSCLWSHLIKRNH